MFVCIEWLIHIYVCVHVCLVWCVPMCVHMYGGAGVVVGYLPLWLYGQPLAPQYSHGHHMGV